MSGGRRRERLLKARLTELAFSASMFLRPGRWIVPGLDRAYHAGPVGDALMRDWRSSTRPRGFSASAVRRRLVGLRARHAPPASFYIDDRGGAGGGGSDDGGEEIRVTKGEGLVIFDHRRSRVTHVRATTLPADYAHHRELLARHLPSPSWSLSDDRRVLVEDKVDGKSLDRLPDGIRMAVALSVMRSCSEMAAAPELQRTGLDDMHLDDVVEHSGGLRREVEETLAWRGRKAEGIPALLAHADLTPFNVIATDQGDWRVIDFEDAAVRPFFFDALSLVVRDGALAAGMRSDGPLREEWTRLCRLAGAADLGTDPLPAMRLTALLAAAAHATHHGGDFSYTLRRLWPTEL